MMYMVKNTTRDNIGIAGRGLRSRGPRRSTAVCCDYDSELRAFNSVAFHARSLATLESARSLRDDAFLKSDPRDFQGT